MAKHKSVVMMSNTSIIDTYDVVGDAKRADGYWGYTDGLHTVSLEYHNLTGNFHLQGTLSVNPTENDWFEIDINPSSNSIPYVEFTHDPSDTSDSPNVIAFTFVGNFVYLRAILNRSNRDDIDEQEFKDNNKAFGSVNKVLLAS